jgi:hypothetical protein
MRTLLLISVAFLTISTTTGQECAWAGKIFADDEMNLNGRVCQICHNGRWVDRPVKCEECKPKTNPVAFNPTPAANDCTARPNRSAPLQTFTDGARAILNGKFQLCSDGQWLESTPERSQICAAQ